MVFDDLTIKRNMNLLIFKISSLPVLALFVDECWHWFGLHLGTHSPVVSSLFDECSICCFCFFDQTVNPKLWSQAWLLQFLPHIDLLCHFDVNLDYCLMPFGHILAQSGTLLASFYESSRMHFNINLKHSLFSCIVMFGNVWQTVSVCLAVSLERFGDSMYLYTCVCFTMMYSYICYTVSIFCKI